MKILHINTLMSGGAAIACQRLDKGLKQLGLDSKILTLDGLLGHGISIKTDLQRRLIQRKQNFFLRGRDKSLEMFSFPQTAYRINKTREYLEADIINLHWTALMVDWPSFFRENNKKIVWTLHDMNPFTGGCHYAGSCKKYLSGCDSCPQLLGTRNPKLSAKIFDNKMTCLNSVSDMTVVSPSRWLNGIASRSKLLSKFNHVVIANSVDEKVFIPQSKTTSRRQLGLPIDKKILLFVADSIDNKRKGYAILLEAIKDMRLENTVLVAVGSKPENQNFNLPVVYLGKVTDEYKMSLIYSAADVFVIPSVEDNLPNTVLESLSCGIPVVGFPIGGMTDMITNGKNGWLTKRIDVKELSQLIKKALVNYKVLKRDSIRSEAMKNFGLLVQAKRYYELYKSL